MLGIVARSRITNGSAIREVVIEMTENFAIRIVTFFVATAVLATIDAVIIRPCRERLHVYVFLLGSGFGAGLFGAVFDQVTFTISRYYFIYLKEIEAPSDVELRLKIAVFGFAAALVPGLIAAASMLVVSLGPRSGIWKVKPLELFRWYWFHMITFCILVLPMVMVLLVADPRGYYYQWSTVLETNEIRRMIVTWAIHLAAYLSGALGTVWAIVSLVRLRKTVVDT
jgi:hypothetical protein